MRTSRKAKDAAGEKQSYVCDTFTGHSPAIVADGVVIFHPRIVNDVSDSDPPPIVMTASTLRSPQHPGGWIFQLGWLTKPQAQEFLGHLPGPTCLPAVGAIATP